MTGESRGLIPSGHRSWSAAKARPLRCGNCFGHGPKRSGAETLDAEKAIAFSENLRRQSRWGEIDHHLLDMLKRELQEKYFVVTGNEDDHFWDREYSLKPDIRAEEVPEPLLRFACYVAVSYKVYGLDFQYLDANYLFGLVEKVRPDMVKKLREHGTGRLPISLQNGKQSTSPHRPTMPLPLSVLLPGTTRRNAAMKC